MRLLIVLKLFGHIVIVPKLSNCLIALLFLSDYWTDPPRIIGNEIKGNSELVSSQSFGYFLETPFVS